MSNKDWSELLEGGWPAVEPPRDFADGVLARLAVPPVQLHVVPQAAVAPPRAWRSAFVFAAVAVAALVIFPLALRRHAAPAHAANGTLGVAVGVAPDLGLERD